jgi:membrane-associated phospholipid phosphatase
VDQRKTLAGAIQASGASRARVARRVSDVAGFLLSSLVLFLSAVPIDETHVNGVEVTVFRWINGLMDFLFAALWIFMQLGNLVAVPVAVVVACLLRRFRLGAALGLAGSLVWLLAKQVKQIVERGRPAELINEVVLRNAPAEGNGYISGHAAVAFALAAVITPYLGRRGRIAVWVLAAVVCLGRVYVGAHLPLDVVGGAAFGFAIGSLANLLMGVPGDHHKVASRKLSSARYE